MDRKLMQMQKRFSKQVMAGLVLLALVFVLFFSVWFVSAHGMHQCCGEDCPVCKILERCMQHLRNFGTLPGVAFFCFVGLLCYLEREARKQDSYCKISLISLKVRLND